MNALDLTVSIDSKRRGSRTDVNKNTFTLTESNNYELLDSYILNSSISYSKTNYKDTDTSFLSKREDSKKEYSIGFTKPIDKTTALQVNYKMIRVLLLVIYLNT